MVPFNRVKRNPFCLCRNSMQVISGRGHYQPMTQYFQWAADWRSRLYIENLPVFCFSFSQIFMVSSVLFFIFADRLNWLAAYRLDTAAAHRKTDLLERVYPEMSYTIWAMGFKKKKKRERKEKEKEKWWNISKMEMKQSSHHYFAFVLLDLIFGHTALYKGSTNGLCNVYILYRYTRNCGAPLHISKFHLLKY